MTTREITRHTGMPAKTIRNWKSGNTADWRYKLLMFLTDESVTPDMLEKTLVDKPEVPQRSSESIDELVKEIKTLQEQVQELQANTAASSNNNNNNKG